MNIRWQALILIILILVSLTLTKFSSETSTAEETPGENVSAADTSSASYHKEGERNRHEVSVSRTNEGTSLAYQRASLSNFEAVQKLPTRKWNIFDPKTSAEIVLVHSLDDDLRLYYENTREEHVLASLTKLLTSVVVVEDIGLNKGISITRKAVDTQGLAGGLKSGESYSTRELLKIMLLTSSNDAAAAFEEFLGGKEIMVKAIQEKANELGMNSITVEDGSGLSDFNYGNANDLLKLTEYIIRKHPEIFTWTQMRSLLVQPRNEPTARKVYNINELVEQRDFWGGKTGTSKVAGENLVSIFNIKGRRVAIILMGSENRYKDTATLIDWVKEAYTFPK